MHNSEYVTMATKIPSSGEVLPPAASSKASAGANAAELPASQTPTHTTLMPSATNRNVATRQQPMAGAAGDEGGGVIVLDVDGMMWYVVISARHALITILQFRCLPQGTPQGTPALFMRNMCTNARGFAGITQ